MKFYEPIAVGIFAVTVIAAAYSLGKRIGYEQGFESANDGAFAEGPVTSSVSGYSDALNTATTVVVDASPENAVIDTGLETPAKTLLISN